MSELTKDNANLFKYLVQGVKDYAIFALDPSGKVMTWNEGARRLKGYEESEIIGQSFEIFYTPEARQVDHPQFELKHAIAHGSYEEEGWRVRKDGSQFWARVLITELKDDQGQHIGFAKVTRDLTEQKLAEEKHITVEDALQRAEEAFNAIVASVKDYAIFLLSPEGNVLTWNEGARRIKGYEAKDIIGKHFSNFYTEPDRLRNHPAFELEQAIEHGSYEEEGWRVRKDGSTFWAAVTITAVRGGGDQSKINRGFIKVTRDLTDRKLAEEQLAKARDAAILANRLKSELVRNITHEVRTPMTSILGIAEILSRDPKLDTETRDAAGNIFDASVQLISILNDLLDFSKLESGKIAIENVAFDVKDVIGSVVGLTKPRAAAKGLEMSVAVGPLPDTVLGDPAKIRQILLNLLNNSVKFTERGSIQLSVEAQNGFIQYAVTDTGIGITEEGQKELFKPFSQVFDRTGGYGGTGLGLSISRQFVELMGGKIGLISEAGKGTTVWFEVPQDGVPPQ